MIDKWFLEDISQALKNKNRLVFIDEGGQAEFLKKIIPSSYLLLEAHTTIEELHLKYQIEKAHAGKKVICYSKMPIEKLTFLREYCETGSLLEIKYLQNYIRQKLHQHLEQNIQLDNEELITAAKSSIGQDHTYWMKLSKGLGDIFDLEKDLLPFLHAPKKYLKHKEKDVQEMFMRKVNQLTGKAYVPKPPDTLAKEVVQTMFKGLLANQPDKLLLSVYHQWLDSRTYDSSFKKYLDKYKVPSVANPWAVHPDHPFQQVDTAALKALTKQLNNKSELQNLLPKIRQRANNRYAKQLGITFWQEVKTLLEFDSQNMNYLSSFPETVDFYTKHFYKIDRAIRHLYTEFLNNEPIIRPFQEYYENLSTILFDKWFQFIQPYQQNQTGLIERIIKENQGNIAVIVGDGVAYEIAKGVAEQLDTNVKTSTNIILADYPSETENNMSQIYMASGAVESIHNRREKYLAKATSKEVAFIHLDKVNEMTPATECLICTYKDIDELGEKMQQRALKLYSSIEEGLVQKIPILLQNGYNKVFLVADHGFVLTGLLDESDKIEVNFDGAIKKSERYIRTVEKQFVGNTFIEMEKAYKDYRYMYFSKNTKPFKTPGVYGFSHGGLSPQELITPYFCFELAHQGAEQLAIKIADKAALKQVTGELYLLKLVAPKGDGSLLTSQRKCYLLFFNEGKQFHKSEVFTIQDGQTIEKEYTFDGYQKVEVVLLDAINKEQIDKVMVQKDNARDLGGLL